jgi:MFS family permease
VEPDDAYRAWAQRRVLRALVVAQVFGGAGLAAGVSVGALLARDLLGSTAGAGLPAALFTAGSAVAATTVGRLSQRHGRRLGLAAGYAAGAVGGAGVVLAAATSNVALFLVSLLVYGSGTATSLQCRYAGADLAEDAHRGRAVGAVLVATTLGAVAGPNLLRLTGDFAEGFGLPRLSGPFMLATVAYVAACAAIILLLRPDPLLTARRIAAAADAAATSSGDRLENLPGPSADRDAGPAPWRPRTRPFVLATSGMVLAQAVMVAVMSMTPVHLEYHRHDLDVVGIVIGLHIAAMYLPSLLTGRLVDRYSAGSTTTAGGAILVVAALLAAAAGANEVLLAVALVLLGLGWNFALVGGTALVTAVAPLASRARVQGLADLGVALAGAVAGLASGVIVATAGFATLSVLAAALAAVVVLVTAVQRSDPEPDPMLEVRRSA